MSSDYKSLSGIIRGFASVYLYGDATVDSTAVPDFRTRDRIQISFVPRVAPSTSYNDVYAYILPKNWEDLAAYINAIYFKYLRGTIVGWDIKDVYAEIFPIPPEDIYGYIQPVHFKNLVASISGVGPIDLSAFIKAVSAAFADLNAYIGISSEYKELYGSITRVIYKDLLATIQSNSYTNLYASIEGHQPKYLYGYINQVYRKDLRALIYISAVAANADLIADLRPNFRADKNLLSVIFPTASNQVNLDGYVYTVVPKSLYGYIGPIVPKYLEGVVVPRSISRVRDLLKIDFGPAKNLLGTITGTGGFLDLTGVVHGFGKSNADLQGYVVSHAINDLTATIFSPYTTVLHGDISSKGLDTIKNLTASLNPLFYNQLYASIAGTYNKNDLFAQLTPFGASSSITASISPLLYRYSNVIVLETKMHKDLYGIVYSGLPCTKSSGFSLLSSYIKGVTESYADLGGYLQPKPYNTILEATIVGGYSFEETSDLSASITSTGAFNNLHGTIFSPISYLNAVIKGRASSYSSINADVKAYEWNVFLNARILPKLLIPKSIPDVSSIKYRKNSSEKILRDLRIKFANHTSEYIYSELLNNTFSLDDSTWGVHLSIANEGIRTDGVYGDKSDEKIKIFFDISDFSSFDEAMRYFIQMLAFGLYTELGATITPTGDWDSLSARVIGTSVDKVRYMYGKVYPILDELVNLNADIEPTGGFSSVKAVIVGVEEVNDTSLSGEIYGRAISDLLVTIN